ncbi:MAG: hypothetical protein WCD00_04715 [Desulfuromonadaceae bacterium]
MLFEFHKYGTAIVVTAIVSLLLAGCGGGSGSGGAEGGGSVGGGFTVTGKITLADGTPINGATVKLYKTSYTIYTIDTFYSTRDLSGLESIKLDSVFLQSTTNEQGVYSFAGVYSGNYTIVPTSSVYVFKWSLEPTRSTIGVVTITDSGTIYIYNPEGTGNKVEGAIIYNTGAPYTITNNILDGQDFEASLPGGTGG